ncbi:GNAT family N-acetyltransferase [Dactylosporangium sp. NPDC005572]|uniref:GNAT family N-acetyltransferase n=1 Tax=Dactylosporangium sp. NPDC005572 TaxID=3156889 RepID=UPI0033BEB80F
MFTTRAARPADVMAVARLWTAANIARHAETGLPLGPVVGVGTAEAERQVRVRLVDGAGFALLVEEADELVAMAFLLQALAQDGASEDPLPGLAHVSMIAVHPDRWGQGLGTLVVEQAQHHARERGFTRGQLWTHASNQRAQRLYARLGWTASGRAKIDDHGERILHYVREL